MNYKRNIKMILFGCIFSCFQFCTNKNPTENEIEGIWKNENVGNLILNKNHTFSGTNLKSGIFLFESKTSNKVFDGRGTWKLQKGDASWEIELYFKSYSTGSGGILYNLYISGEKGILENQPPWYLYIWKDDEGGERIKFKKL
jgi:hypothetical protein